MEKTQWNDPDKDERPKFAEWAERNGFDVNWLPLAWQFDDRDTQAAWIGWCAKAAQAAAPAQAEPSECDWQQEDDENMPQTYRTRCGQLWSFIEGGPADNNMKFCHCCGKPVKEVAAA